MMSSSPSFMIFHIVPPIMWPAAYGVMLNPWPRPIVTWENKPNTRNKIIQDMKGEIKRWRAVMIGELFLIDMYLKLNATYSKRNVQNIPYLKNWRTMILTQKRLSRSKLTQSNIFYVDEIQWKSNFEGD